MMTRKLLEQEGFDVDEALDGAEARTFYFRDHLTTQQYPTH